MALFLPTDISTSNLLGRSFIRLKEGPSGNARYFQGIASLKSFLDSAEFKSTIKGFYLSVWGENSEGMRFSYFTMDKEASVKCLDKGFSSLGLLKFQSDDAPKAEQFQTYYGPRPKTELEFRRFLHMITQVGLGLLDFDVEYSQRLAAKYRLEIAPDINIDARTFFEPAFNKSPNYVSLDDDLREELWDGVRYWYTPTDDWMHMFVVMLLPGDLIYSPNPLVRSLFVPRRPLPKSFLDEARKHFNLPSQWSP